MKKTFINLISIIAFLAIIFSIKSIFINKPLNQRNIENIENSDISSPIILPHFDFAREQRQAYIKKISNEITPKKIVILSVDHFGDGNQITTTDKEWDFANNEVKIDKALFQSLLAIGIENNQNVFLNEHGIKNILPELVQAYPEAEFLPIIIGGNISIDKTEDFFTNLYRLCPDSLIVGSVDFSHYNPNSLAQIHDQFSLSALSSLDEEKAYNAETDSPQIMYIATKWAKTKGNKGFEVYAKGNSGDSLKDDEIETTSYIIGKFSKSTSDEQSSTFLIGGDVMLDRLINHKFSAAGIENVFSNLGKRVFWGSDMATINLEGPISDKPIIDDISVDNLVFNFPPESIGALKYLNINSVSLANNHTGNAGASGLQNTKSVLQNDNIKSFGEPSGLSEMSVARLDGNIPMSIIGINFLPNYDLDEIGNKIKTEKEAGRFVIVYPHWGNEYQNSHNKNQQMLAERMIDDGADIIVGSHPHVIQDTQVYKGKPIIYSLGNFVFDQTFSKETQQGLLLGGVIYKDRIELSFFPTEQKNLKPQLAKDSTRQNILSKIFSGNDYKKLRSDTIVLSR